MRASKNSFLDHVKMLRQAALAAGAEAIMAFDTMNVFVRSGQAHWHFQPKFLAEINGVRQYTTAMTEDTTMFAGWLPYQLKRWQIAHDKLAFKRYAQSVALNTPAHWLTPGEGVDVLVKQALSSFGAKIKGPLRSSLEHDLNVAQGEYFEKFIPGRILKIWYWDATPVCAEMDSMPFVIGNGIQTVAELIVRRANATRRRTEDEKKALLADSEPIVHYHGHALSDVLPKGARLLVEFRYSSRIMQPSDRRIVDLMQPNDEKWTAGLSDIGTKLVPAIPSEIREHTLFTVDAILDKDNQIRLLEMNCNPTVHPLVYPVMMSRLLAAAGNAKAQPVQAAFSPAGALVQ